MSSSALFVKIISVVLPDTAGGSSQCTLRIAAAAGRKLRFSPLLSGRGGDTSMTLQDVLGLFALVGGTVFVTFQIVWTVTHDKKRK